MTHYAMARVYICAWSERTRSRRNLTTRHGREQNVSDLTVKRNTKLSERRIVLIGVLALAALMAARVAYVELVVFPRERLQEAAAADVAADAAFKRKMAETRALIERTKAQMVREAHAQESPKAAQPKAREDAGTDFIKKNAEWFRRHGLPTTASDSEIGRALAFDICKRIECKDVPPAGK